MNNTQREIIIDGNLYGSSPACRLRGLGAAAGVSSSCLLIDYKMKQPEAYQEITELLFRKNYGAGLSHIRIECGENIKNNENEKPDITGNPAFVLAADAKRINPDITIDFHFENPIYGKYISGENPEDIFEAEYKLCKEIINTAFDKYGLKADFISFSADKFGKNIFRWIKYLNRRLNSELLLSYDYSKIITAVYDTPEGIVSAEMIADEELRRAVGAIGYSTINSSENIRILNEKYQKEIWCCDGKTPEAASEFSVNADGSGLIGKNSLIDITDNIIFSFHKCAAMYEYNPAVLSCFPGTGKACGSLIKADAPWSGHYSYSSGIWGAAHITYFTDRGWKFAGNESEYSGEYAAFISDNGDYTIVFVNDSDKPRKYSVSVRNIKKADEFVHCVETRGPESCDNYSVNWFRVVDKIMPAENDCGFSYTLEVKPFSVMTCTTMSVDSVNGTDSIKKCGFADKSLALPYTDNFCYGESILKERGRKPFYASESYGKFEIASVDWGNALVQISEQNMELSDGEEKCSMIIFGDKSWSDYSVKADAKFADCKDGNYLAVGLRYNHGSLSTESGECGYQLRIFPDCRWQLRYMDDILEEETASEIIMPTEWNQLRISAKGRRIKCFINKSLVCEHIASAPIILSGRVYLCSAQCGNMFRNLSVSPVLGFSSHNAFYDCLSGEFTYSDGWKKNISAGGGFCNFTSVSNSGENEYFEFEFSGEAVALTGRAENLRLKVEIDNRIMAAGLFINHCGAGQVFYSKGNLGEGVHKLKLIILSGNLEFDYAETAVSGHWTAKGKIGAAITENTVQKPVKKLKKSTLILGIGLAAAGAGALLLGQKIKRGKLKRKK